MSYTERTSIFAWTAPRWATDHTTEDGGLWHTVHHPNPFYVIGLDGEPREIALKITQRDAIRVTDHDGAVSVHREGDPVLMLGGLTFNLAQADTLGRAIVAMIEATEHHLDVTP
jgi:hypothetical protein